MGTEPDDFEGCGARLRVARRKAGVSLAHAALGLGISMELLLSFEEDLLLPFTFQAAKMAEMYGVTARWLYYGDDADEPHAGGAAQ